MTSAGQRPRGAGRAQLQETALRLFGRDGVEGTSLQTIANEMGVSKAAVYYHYKTKDELVLEVLTPLIDELSALARRVEAHRSRRARVDEFVVGLVRIAVANHSPYSVITRDPYVARLLGQQQTVRLWWQDIMRLIAGTEPDPFAHVAVSMFLSGLAGQLQDPGLTGIDASDLSRYLVDCGRRLLHIRHRPPAL